MKPDILIRQAAATDYASLWNMFMEVAKTGESFMHDSTTSYDEWEDFWCGKGVSTFVAVEGDVLVGSYILKANQPGLGHHVVNGGYMVSKNHRGKKIGKLLGQDSIQKAIELNYKAIQFNAVVATNKHAIKLWEQLGFNIVGTNPKAFNHRSLGLVDTLIMYLELPEQNIISR